MKEGDLVVVLGNLDNRIRDKLKDTLVIGTLYSFLTDNQVCVIIEHDGYELWTGNRKDICLATEQL
mgnify:CR=1 FL=1